MIHTIVFSLGTPLRIADLLLPGLRVQRIPSSGRERGACFEVIGYPSFTLIGRVHSELYTSPIGRVQLSLSDHYDTYAQFTDAIDSVFSPRAFEPGMSQLQAIDFFVDLPIRTEDAVLGAIYEPARGYVYGKGTFSTPRQIVIGVNPCLAVYDRARRLRRTHTRHPHRVREVPQGVLSRFEMRYKREVQSGAQVLPAALMEIFHPAQLLPFATELNNQQFDPFGEAQYYDTQSFQLPLAPDVHDSAFSWDDEACRQQIQDYIRDIGVAARIKGMMEVVNLHMVRGYCRPMQGLRGPFREIEARLTMPFNLTHMFRQRVREYFGLGRSRPAPGRMPT